MTLYCIYVCILKCLRSISAQARGKVGALLWLIVLFFRHITPAADSGLAAGMLMEFEVFKTDSNRKRIQICRFFPLHIYMIPNKILNALLKSLRLQNKF